jgi:hypothetical protein
MSCGEVENYSGEGPNDQVVIDGFIMKLDTEEEAVYLDRDDSLSKFYSNNNINNKCIKIWNSRNCIRDI